MKSIKQKLIHLSGIVLAVGALSAIGVGSAMAQEKAGHGGASQKEPFFTGSVEELRDKIYSSEMPISMFFQRNEGKLIVVNGYYIGHEKVTDIFDKKKFENFSIEIASKRQALTPAIELLQSGEHTLSESRKVPCKSKDQKIEPFLSKFEYKQPVRIVGILKKNAVVLATITDCKFL